MPSITVMDFDEESSKGPLLRPTDALAGYSEVVLGDKSPPVSPRELRLEAGAAKPSTAKGQEVKGVDDKKKGVDSVGKRRDGPVKSVPTSPRRAFEEGALEDELEVKEEEPRVRKNEDGHLSDFETSGDEADSALQGDWNERFQAIMELIAQFTPNTPVAEEITANVALIGLAEDFIYSATAYGKIIISEVYMDDSQKTIKPVDIGGIAGGSKYIVHNILFKFALDTEGLFGGDDAAAAKVAGLELKGLQSYANCNIPGLCLPLMALVDYRGFRLIAMSVLPISSSTIVYGSNDGGVTVHASNDTFNQKMRRTAEILNVKPHVAGVDNATSKLLYSAADIEGHVGRDGRFYLIDFSRTFPCETVDRAESGSNLTKLFRAEFVRRYPIPLCSDAYSGFVSSFEHSREVDEATKTLYSETIPACVSAVVDVVARTEISQLRISEVIHSMGVNVRHLGALFDCVTKASGIGTTLRNQTMGVLLMEMFARVIKTALRRKLREKMKAKKLPLEEPYRNLVIAYLNLVLGCNPRSDEYWNTTLQEAVINKFKGLNPQYLRLKASTKQCVLFNRYLEQANCRWLLLTRVGKMMGFRCTPQADKEFRTNYNRKWDCQEPFSRRDIEDIGQRIKHMDIVSQAEGYLLLKTGLSYSGTDPVNAVNCFEKAIEQYEEVMSSNSTSKVTLRNCAEAILLLEEQQSNGNSDNYNVFAVQRAWKYLQRAVQLDPIDPRSYFKFAQVLEKQKKYDEAEEYYLQAIELDSNYVDALREYGIFLQRVRGDMEMGERFVLRSLPTVSRGAFASGRNRTPSPHERLRRRGAAPRKANPSKLGQSRMARSPKLSARSFRSITSSFNK